MRQLSFEKNQHLIFCSFGKFLGETCGSGGIFQHDVLSFPRIPRLSAVGWSALVITFTGLTLKKACLPVVSLF